MRAFLETLYGPEDGRPRHPAARIAIGVALVGVAAFIVWGRAERFVADPRILPPSPDTPWYVWRTELLTVAPPGELVSWVGPSGGAGGGYRVAAPLLGALLRRVAGVAPPTVSTLLVAGLNGVLALAIGAAAYRLRRDPLVFGAVALVAGALLFRNPFLGFTDNVLSLVLLVTALSFLGDGARGAAPVGVCVFLAFLAHPPAATAFVLAALGAAIIGVVFRRPLRRTAVIEGATAGAAAGGALMALLAWRLGAWGPGVGFGDAIHPAMNTHAVFEDRLRQWVGMLQPSRTLPLLLLGIAALLVAYRAFVREPSRRAALIWILPALGAVGYLTTRVYPYHRFLNVTVAPVLVAGLGLWVLARPFVGVSTLHRGLLPVAAVAVVVVVAVVAPMWADGRDAWADQGEGFLPRSLRPPLAAASALLEGPDPPPAVFVSSIVGARAWNSRRGTANRVKASLPAASALDAYVYVGSVARYLDGRPTGDPALGNLSRESLAHLDAGVGDREPLVLLVREWNQALGNQRFLQPDRSLKVDRNLFVLKGEGLARPDRETLDRARDVGLAERQALAEAAGADWASGRVVGASLGIAALALLPGLLLARPLRRTDVPYLLGTAPAVSLAATLFVGFVLLALFRRPVSAGMAWAFVGATNVLSGGLLALDLWREKRGGRDRVDRPELPNRPEPTERPVRLDGDSGSVRASLAVLVAGALVAALAGAGLAGLGSRGPDVAAAARSLQPNLLFVMSDDQRWDTMDVMPRTTERFNIEFANAVATTPLCCPSRSSFLTGRSAAHTGVLTNADYPVFRDGDEARDVAPLLQRSGYYTGFVGKYFNHFLFDYPVPPGWDEFYGRVYDERRGLPPEERYSGLVLNHRYRQDGRAVDRIVTYPDPGYSHSSEVFGRLARRFIRRAQDPEHNPDGKPWALLVWTHAPNEHRVKPADARAELPRWELPPSFLEADLTDKPREVRVSRNLVADPEFHARIRAQQLRMLLGVDRMVEAIFDELDRLGLTEDTWGVYASDHGRLWGEHGLARKLFAYEESIRFPLRVWAPGFPRATIDALVANVDVVPTLTALALDPADHRYDGRSLLPLIGGDAGGWRDAVLIQNWATYRYDAVRTPAYTYVRWPRTGHEELYDLRRDPFQLQSVAETRPGEVERMRALLERLLD